VQKKQEFGLNGTIAKCVSIPHDERKRKHLRGFQIAVETAVSQAVN
jgi:hypothetical protein